MPAPNSGWIGEIALDVEWAHAIAPKANILLVEANSSSDTDLFTAVRYAASQPGVVAVSMSWGGGEFSGETELRRQHLHRRPSGHAGVTFVASSGDSGAPALYPSASPNVALGRRHDAAPRQRPATSPSETGWSGSGGGISAYRNAAELPEGRRHPDRPRGGPRRTWPTTPTRAPASRSTTATTTARCAPWVQYGGTSAAAPQWAALDRHRRPGPRPGRPGLASTAAARRCRRSTSCRASDFHDITSGTSTGSPEYSAGAGYDLVTGRGTPVANLVVTAPRSTALPGPA